MPYVGVCNRSTLTNSSVKVSSIFLVFSFFASHKCSGPNDVNFLATCYYHGRQWSPMHSTHTQATCQYLFGRYSSISDSPAASFGHGCDINFFGKFWFASHDDNNDNEPPPPLFISSQEQPAVLPYHPCCRSNRYCGWICSVLIGGGYMILIHTDVLWLWCTIIV